MVSSMNWTSSDTTAVEQTEEEDQDTTDRHRDRYVLRALAKSIGEYIVMDPSSIRPDRFDPLLFTIPAYHIRSLGDDVFLSVCTRLDRGFDEKAHDEIVDYTFKKGSADWFELEGLLDSIKKHLDIIYPDTGVGYE